jgi:hypothetical protein
MRILGKSTTDKNKYVVEISAKELAIFNQSQKSWQADCDLFDKLGITPSGNDFVQKEEKEERTKTTDEILDDYNAKRLSKYDMKKMMSEIIRSR